MRFCYAKSGNSTIVTISGSVTVDGITCDLSGQLVLTPI
jgi:hypothetical protein